MKIKSEIIIMLLIIVTSFSCVSETPPQNYNHNNNGKWADKSIEYKRAYFIGVGEAKKELELDNATIYIYGKLPTSMKLIHKGTGLTFKPIAGCIVDEKIKGRSAGHNDYIFTNYIKKP